MHASSILRHLFSIVFLVTLLMPSGGVAAKVAPAPCTIKVPILMYHFVDHITKGMDKSRIAMDILPSVLDSQIKALKEKGYRGVFISQIPGMIATPPADVAKTIALTFDDGYDSFYTNALPLLKKYDFRATLYVVTGFLDTPGYVTTEQLKDIAASGLVEIGAHTLDHSNLRLLKDVEVINQVTQSKAILERLLGTKIVTFAYPYGTFDARTLKAVADAGFQSAVTIKYSPCQSNEHIFQMPRLRAGQFTGARKFIHLGEVRE